MSAYDDKHINFSRNLNLLNEKDLLSFLHESENAGNILPVSSASELSELIKFGHQLFPDSAFSISSGFVQINIRPRSAIGYNFTGIILPLNLFLFSFRDDTNFINKVKTNISNPTQFDDTIFELMCLKQFHENGYYFEYEPSISVRYNEKRPDFRLTKDNFKVYVECEQIRLGYGKSEVQFAEKCKYVRERFPGNLDKLLNVEDLRLEVNFKKNPSEKDLELLIKELRDLCFENKRVCELPVIQIGDVIEYTIVKQNVPNKFPMQAMQIAHLVVGAEPRGIWNSDTDSPEGEILFTSTDLIHRRRQTLINRIRKAKNQLPEDEYGIIILGKANIAIAKKEIEKRMSINEYMNILAFIVNPFEDFCPCYRKNYRKVLSDLFEGFQANNPFKKLY